MRCSAVSDRSILWNSRGRLRRPIAGVLPSRRRECITGRQPHRSATDHRGWRLRVCGRHRRQRSHRCIQPQHQTTHEFESHSCCQFCFRGDRRSSAATRCSRQQCLREGASAPRSGSTYQTARNYQQSSKTIWRIWIPHQGVRPAHTVLGPTIR